MAIDTSGPRTRRAILTGVLGAAAATIATAIGRAAPVTATNDPMSAGTVYNATASTGVTTTSGNGLQGYSSDSGASGVYGESTNQKYGVAGRSNGRNLGVNDSAGVMGEATADGGHGVHGIATVGPAVYGTATGFRGTGVYGTSTSASGGGIGVLGESSSTAGYGVAGVALGGQGTALIGSSGDFPPNAPRKTGVYGLARNDAASVGVRGESSTGRGGYFKGKLAQLGLAPSTAVSHPHSGAAGDLFVDKSHRLWFCKGGTTWKQIA